MVAMNKMFTVHSAEPADIWPNGSGHSPEVEAEIIRIARTEISADEVARSGLVFAEWYKPFALAEGRWRQRQEQRAEQQRAEDRVENSNARRLAALEQRLARVAKIVDALDQMVFVGPKAKGYSSKEKGPFIERVVEAVVDRIANERRFLRDTGIWDSEKRYGPGAAATFDGALWTCLQENRGVRPGDGVAWRLVHKSDVTELRLLVRDLVREQLRDEQKRQAHRRSAKDDETDRAWAQHRKQREG
jgi:hypothetical protein